jgi:uncharacterized protein with FMN-binding domain
MKKIKILISILLVFFSAALLISAEKKDTAAIYKDGTYRASSPGYEDDITVEVIISKGRIKSVKIIEENESRPGRSLKKIPEAIIKAQGTDGVDAVSGATFSSGAIIKAVEKALKKAVIPKPGDLVSTGNSKEISRPEWLIGYYDSDGKSHTVKVLHTGIVSDDPPVLMISLKKETHVCKNIIEKKAFSVNISPAGSKAQKDIKFKTSKCKKVDAPYIKGFPLIAECRVQRVSKSGDYVIITGQIENLLKLAGQSRNNLAPGKVGE